MPWLWTRECGDYNNSVCYFCLTTHFCTWQDDLTGKITQKMKSPYTAAQRVGGNIPVIKINDNIEVFIWFAFRDLDLNCSVAMRWTLAIILEITVFQLATSHCKSSCKSVIFCLLQSSFHFFTRDAATREERCNIPKKYFLKIGDPPDSMLTSKNNKTCIESENPSVFICDKEPENEHARVTHRKITQKLRKIKKKIRRRKLKIKRRQRQRAEKKKNKKRKGRGRNRKKKSGRWKEKRKRNRKRILNKEERRRLTG